MVGEGGAYHFVSSMHSVCSLCVFKCIVSLCLVSFQWITKRYMNE